MPRAALRAARASTSNTERDACDAFDPRDRPRREDRVGEDRDHVGRNDEDDDDEASSTATEMVMATLTHQSTAVTYLTVL